MKTGYKSREDGLLHQSKNKQKWYSLRRIDIVYFVLLPRQTINR